MGNYEVAPITQYDEWDMVYVTKIYKANGNQALQFCACGSTETESRKRAEVICRALNRVKKG